MDNRILRPSWPSPRRILPVLATLLLAAIARPEITLRYACMDSGDSLRFMERQAREFEAANPGIRVQIESISDEYVQKLLTQYAAGVAPDLAQLSIHHYRAFAMRGALVGMDRYIKESPDVDLREWYPNVIRAFTWEGQLWGLPRDVGPFGLIFTNRDLFKKAGLPDPDGTWTWSERERPELREKDFVWVAKRLTERGPDGKVRQFGLAPEWPQLWFNLLLQSRGLSLCDRDEAPARMQANDPPVVSLMEFARDAIVRDNWIPTWDQVATERQSSVFDEFKRGRIAMYITFPNYLERLRKEVKFDWDVTLFPAYAGRARSFPADGSAAAIFRSTRHPDAAWKLAKWFAGRRGQRELAKASLAQPANRVLATEPGVWLYGPGLPASRAEPRNLFQTDEAAMVMEFAATPEYFEDTKINLDGAAFDILSGTRPVRETLDRVNRESQTRLDAARRQMPKDPINSPVAVAVGLGLFLAIVAWVYFPERRRKLTSAERTEARAAYVFLVPTLLGITGFTIGPMIFSLILSTTNADTIRPPLWRGVQNYVDAFTVDPLFWQSLKVTLLYTVLSTPLGILVALTLALLLNAPVRGIAAFRALYYIPSLVSGVAASLIWMRLFNPENGLINRMIYGPSGTGNFLGLGQALSQLAGTPGKPVNWLASENTVLPAFVLMGTWGAGASAIIFLAGLQGISKSYYEAASIDGAGPFRRLLSVTLPLLTPAIFFSLVTGIIGAFQVFTQAFVMTQGGPNNATQFYLLNLYNQGFKSLKMGYASALAWILFVIVLAITLAQLKTSKRWVFYEGEGR